MKLIQMIWFNL